ncbi:hypothetical protein RTCIAT899_PC00440 (plasmid) [Rhizobium tropici CIAT 899]|nr:hypothetical protein RTCIAT899_PC00440 [Rhizobium tropici CIAT 899]
MPESADAYPASQQAVSAYARGGRPIQRPRFFTLHVPVGPTVRKSANEARRSGSRIAEEATYMDRGTGIYIGTFAENCLRHCNRR